MRVRTNMIWSGLICSAMVLGGCGLCSAIEAIAPSAPVAPAGDAQNSFPYGVILKRNAFGLYPAPLPPGPPPAPEQELAKVIFGGTKKKGTQVWAMFAVQTTDARKQETTAYMSLTNGEALGPVELLRISPDGDEVEILNSGTRVVLNMKDNGFEKTSPAGGLAPLGMRQLPGSLGTQMPSAQTPPAAPPTTYDASAGINVRYAENAPRSSGIRLAGPTAPPNNPGVLIPVAPPAGGMPPNSTPPPAPVDRNPIMPPTPSMP